MRYELKPAEVGLHAILTRIESREAVSALTAAHGRLGLEERRTGQGERDTGQDQPLLVRDYPVDASAGFELRRRGTGQTADE